MEDLEALGQDLVCLLVGKVDKLHPVKAHALLGSVLLDCLDVADNHARGQALGSELGHGLDHGGVLALEEGDALDVCLGTFAHVIHQVHVSLQR